MKFSLIIPCYNEAANIPLLLDRCAKVAAYPGAEVVLVDNGSTDDSQDVLKTLLPKYPGCRSVKVERNQGYGHGILHGLREAHGEILAWTHADMQTDPLDVLKGLEFFQDSGKVFVKGRRYGRPLADVAFTVAMSVFETLLLFKPMWDINAQPTMFTKDFFSTWKNPPTDFSLDLFAYYQAKTAGLTVHRFPVLFDKRAHGVSHWNVNWAAKWKFIKRTVSYSLALKKELQNS